MKHKTDSSFYNDSNSHPVDYTKTEYKKVPLVEPEEGQFGPDINVTTKQPEEEVLKPFCVNEEEGTPNCANCNNFYIPFRLNCNSCIRSDYINQQNTVISDRFTPVILAGPVTDNWMYHYDI